MRGDALAFYAQPGADLGRRDWQQLDNAIYDELSDPGADMQQVVADLKAGERWRGSRDFPARQKRA